MTELVFSTDELQTLIDVACDGTLTESDVEQMERLLRGNAKAQQFYLSQVRLDRWLRWEFAHQAPKPVSPRPAPLLTFLRNTIHGAIDYFPESWPVAILITTVIFAIAAVIGSNIYVKHYVQVAHQSDSHPSPSSPLPSPSSTDHQPLTTDHSDVVARITGMVDCKWSVVSGQWSVGEKLKTENQKQKTLLALGDTLSLSSGLLEITYNTGAKVILQGPVTYEVDSKDGGYLSLGKLTAKVEKKVDYPLSTNHSPLFAVRTPTATVTDLGTEFGVEVSKEGNTTSHVFRGVVEVQLAANDGKDNIRTVRLSENESVWVEKHQGSAKITMQLGTADGTAFIRSEQLPKVAAKLAEEQRLKPFHRWQTYSKELCRDPSLLAYYDFQQKEGSPSVLTNVAGNGDHALDGTIVGAWWSEGRMVGKQALQFRDPDDYVRICLPQKVDNLTLAVWLNVELLDNGLSGLLMSDRWVKDGLVAWQLTSDGCVKFGIYGFSDDIEDSTPVFDRHRRYRWTHLAAVYDHAAARLWLYANGNAMGEKKVAKDVPICIGAARIGHWEFGNIMPGTDVRNFVGRIDELAVFGRALTADEIRQMFEAGKPSKPKGT